MFRIVRHDLDLRERPWEDEFRVRASALLRPCPDVGHLDCIARGNAQGSSALVLVAARLRHMAGTKWGTRRYLNMDKLRAAEAEKESALGVA